MATRIWSVPAKRLKSGDVVVPTKFALQHGWTEILLTLTVGDPTADPATDAKLMIVVEASDDGSEWYPVSHTWAGTSGVYTAAIPIRGRQMRVRGWVDMESQIAVTALAV